MFDSPFEYCHACGHYVLLDQTCRECAREHGCAAPCPLQELFTGVEFVCPDGMPADQRRVGDEAM
ncbi:MAG: hypothetical protein IT518_17750 [Burkholderiales bacterium]|nr:hypothetical protein [Burkholderiales bacterium]